MSHPYDDRCSHCRIDRLLREIKATYPPHIAGWIERVVRNPLSERSV